MVEQGIWKITTKLELMELYKNLDIAVDIKKRRFKRIGHVVRVDQRRTVKKIFESKLEGSTKRRRPRLK